LSKNAGSTNRESRGRSLTKCAARLAPGTLDQKENEKKRKNDFHCDTLLKGKNIFSFQLEELF